MTTSPCPAPTSSRWSERIEIPAIAEQLGISNEQAADAVAEVLPQVVDRVSPEGELPAETDLDDLFAQLAGESAS